MESMIYHIMIWLVCNQKECYYIKKSKIQHITMKFTSIYNMYQVLSIFTNVLLKIIKCCDTK